MPKYKCTYTDGSGRIEKRKIEASSADAAAASLKREGLFPVEITVLENRNGKKISASLLLDFTSSLSLMMVSGLSLKDSLTMSASDGENKKSSALNEELKQRIIKGDSFYSALEKSCTGLPPLYSGLIRIGEKIGSLKEILNQLQIYLDDRKKFKDMIIGAMIYPLFVLILVLIAALAAALFIIPAIQEIMIQMGSASQEITDLISRLERFRISSLFLVPLLFGLALLLTLIRKMSSRIALWSDRLLIRTPLIKTVLGESEIYNVLYALEILTANGIGLEEALSQGAAVVKNREIARQMENIRKQIEKGERLSRAFAAADVFPPRLSRWISFGESTGRVEEIFGQLKDYYKSRIENRTKLIMTVIEPAMIIGIGIIMLVFVVNVVVPLVTVYGSIL